MKKLKYFLGTLLLVSNFTYASTIEDNQEVLNVIKTSPMKIVSGVKEAKDGVQTIFTYDEDSMYTIYCRVNFLTTILLQPGEKVLFMGGGDTARWRRANANTGSRDGEREVVYIKPSSINLKTNLVINTNKRTYQLNLISHKALYNPLIKWQYPEDELIQKIKDAEEQKRLDSMQEKIVNPENLNFNYSFDNKKSVGFCPTQVYDDNVKTYLIFKNHLQELPVLYVTENDETFLVNYRVKGNMFIVDRTFKEAELRIGKDTIKIFKK